MAKTTQTQETCWTQWFIWQVRFCDTERALLFLGNCCFSHGLRWLHTQAPRTILDIVLLCSVQTFLPYLPEYPAFHGNVAGLRHGMMRCGHHPRISNRLRRADILDGAGGALEETLHNTRAGTIIGTREGHMTLPRTLKVTRQRDRTKIEETLVRRRAEKLRWHPRWTSRWTQRMSRQRKRSCGNCSASWTIRKGASAPHIRRTLKQIPRPAISTRRPCRTWTLWQSTLRSSRRPWRRWRMNLKKVTCCLRIACEAVEELDKAQKDQDRLHARAWSAASKEFSTCWANLNGAFREVNKCRALHVEACADLKKACQRTTELKRQATDAHEKNAFSQRTVQKSNQWAHKIRGSCESQLGLLGMVCERNGCSHSLSDLRSAVPWKQRSEVLAGCHRAYWRVAEATSRGTASESSSLWTWGCGAGREAAVKCRFSSVPCFFCVGNVITIQRRDTFTMVSPRERFCEVLSGMLLFVVVVSLTHRRWTGPFSPQLYRWEFDNESITDVCREAWQWTLSLSLSCEREEHV